MRTWLVVTVLAAIAAPAEADQRGFTEVVVGLVHPTGDSTWKDDAGSSLKLGLRAGDLVRRRGALGGLELALDWTPVESPSSSGLSVNRFRAQLGGRAVAKAGETAFFFRFDAGVDWVRGSRTGLLAKCDGSSVGIALEPGLGVVEDLGPIAFGAQAALPIAFHSDDGDSCLDGRYKAVDADVLFTVSTRI